MADLGFRFRGSGFESFRARQLSPYKITVSAVCSTQEKPGRGTRPPRRLSRDSAAARPTKHFFLNERTSVDQCLYRCWAGPHGELDGRVWSRNSCCVERRHFPGACCRRIVALNRNRADAPRALVLGLRFVVRSVTIQALFWRLSDAVSCEQRCRGSALSNRYLDSTTAGACVTIMRRTGSMAYLGSPSPDVTILKTAPARRKRWSRFCLHRPSTEPRVLQVDRLHLRERRRRASDTCRRLASCL